MPRFSWGGLQRPRRTRVGPSTGTTFTCARAPRERMRRRRSAERWSSSRGRAGSRARGSSRFSICNVLETGPTRLRHGSCCRCNEVIGGNGDLLLVLAAAVSVLGASAAKADPRGPIVLVLRGPTSDPATSEAAVRVEGELTAAGFRVKILPLNGTDTEGSLESAGRELSPVAAFAIFARASEADGSAIAEILGDRSLAAKDGHRAGPARSRKSQPRVRDPRRARGGAPEGRPGRALGAPGSIASATRRERRRPPSTGERGAEERERCGDASRPRSGQARRGGEGERRTAGACKAASRVRIGPRDWTRRGHDRELRGGRRGMGADGARFLRVGRRIRRSCHVQRLRTFAHAPGGRRYSAD